MKKILSLTLICLAFFPACCQYKTRLIYTCDFNQATDLKDWVMEGPGKAEINNGQLILSSEYFDIVKNYYDKNGGRFGGNGEMAFYPSVEEAMRLAIGDSIKYYFSAEKFKGGHIVFWNKFITPSNYVLTCDFQSLSPNALHMLMFSCAGIEGEDVFDPKLNLPRNGMAAQYTQGDIKNYRISFFAPDRHTSNMRKSPGRTLLIKGEDFSILEPHKKHSLKIVKYLNTIEWYIDGRLSFRYEDLLDNYLKGGQTAIRLMVPAKGSYDNFNIYEIL